MSDYSDTETQSEGWTRIDRRGRPEKARQREEPEEEAQEYSWLSLPRRTAFPPVAKLIEFSTPVPTAPKPLDERTLADHAKAFSEIDAARAAVAAAASKIKKTTKELGDAKAANASVNKWSTTSKTAAQAIDRLNKQLTAETAEAEGLKKKLDTVTARWKTTLDLVSAREMCAKGWKDYNEMVARHKQEEAEQEAEMAREMARALRKAATTVAAAKAAAVPPAPWALALAATALY